MVRIVATHHSPLRKANLVVTNNGVVSYCVCSLSVDGGVRGGTRQLSASNCKRMDTINSTYLLSKEPT